MVKTLLKSQKLQMHLLQKHLYRGQYGEQTGSAVGECDVNEPRAGIQTQVARVYA